MGLVTSALYIGKSALLTYQSALQVAGQNITNAGSANYARQTPVLTGLPGVRLPEGFVSGGGVQMSALRRNVDEALENRLRRGISDEESALVEQQVLGRIEALFNELTEYDLSSLLNQFFNSWSDLQNTPQDMSARGVVVTTGSALAESFQRMRRDLVASYDELNERINPLVSQVNQFSQQIADLNVQIVQYEAGGNAPAAALRDQRDAVLQDLAKLVEVRIYAQVDGSVNVFAGNDPLVQAGQWRELTVRSEMVDGLPTSRVRFADNNIMVDVRGGELEGIVNSRRQHVLQQVDNLDALALALIQDVNLLHSEGQGLVGWTSLTGTYGVLDAAVALNTADNGLDMTAVNGSFLVTVTTGTGDSARSEMTAVHVDLDGIGADTTLNDLSSLLDAIDGISASVTADGRLKIEASGADTTFSFSEDSSNVLAALGINTFFGGRGASDISVNDLLVGSPELVAAATEHSQGDGSNAGRLASLATNTSATLGSMSLLDHYGTVVGASAVAAQAAVNAVSAADVIVGSLKAQRESVSGVSLDEEAIRLMQYERSFQGAARYVMVVDELINELLGLVR